jgi:hypothetical protein
MRFLISENKRLTAELAEAIKLADSFYNWTLINYPEEEPEYQKEVRELMVLIGKEGEK